MHFTTAFLQYTGNQRLGHEEQLLKSEFERRGVPVELYSAKRIQRRNLPLTTSTFIAGDMDAMHGAMRQLGIEPPEPDDYPECLRPWMHRRVWKTTLDALERQLLDGTGPPVFAKPAERRKGFTGRVFESYHDFAGLGSTSRRQDVWCSEVVAWRSEFRVYVIGQEIVSVDHYGGDASAALDSRAVQDALAAYRAGGNAPSAYGIDFGVLSTGQTALIEANDGYALGAYTIGAQPYTDLLMARWAELLSQARPGH